MERSRMSRRAGFTLVEVLLVVLILATLAAVAVVAIWPRKAEFDIDATQLKVEKVVQGLKMYELKLGYPTEEQGLKALIEKPTFDDEAKGKLWHGPYTVESADDLKDQWGHDFVYKLADVTSGDTTRKAPHVYSIGPNGQDENGDGDDIKNKSWAAETATAK